jgi:hypothetical protein
MNNEENSALEKQDANIPIISVLLYQFENWKLSHILATTSCRPTTCIRKLYKTWATHYNMHMGIAWTRKLKAK